MRQRSQNSRKTPILICARQQGALRTGRFLLRAAIEVKHGTPDEAQKAKARFQELELYYPLEQERITEARTVPVPELFERWFADLAAAGLFL